mmetsp:Transcript_55466/g.162005  ORF Transcript_55466/g.162005 Transcript_55466/m.162005 type:complete len:169 (-) Transcript_55466:3-509(-)
MVSPTFFGAAHPLETSKTAKPLPPATYIHLSSQKQISHPPCIAIALVSMISPIRGKVALSPPVLSSDAARFTMCFVSYTAIPLLPARTRMPSFSANAAPPGPNLPLSLEWDEARHPVSTQQTREGCDCPVPILRVWIYRDQMVQFQLGSKYGGLLYRLQKGCPSAKMT